MVSMNSLRAHTACEKEKDNGELSRTAADW
jgi:hypothetical protein